MECKLNRYCLEECEQQIQRKYILSMSKHQEDLRNAPSCRCARSTFNNLFAQVRVNKVLLVSTKFHLDFRGNTRKTRTSKWTRLEQCVNNVDTEIHHSTIHHNCLELFCELLWHKTLKVAYHEIM